MRVWNNSKYYYTRQGRGMISSTNEKAFDEIIDAREAYM